MGPNREALLDLLDWLVRSLHDVLSFVSVKVVELLGPLSLFVSELLLLILKPRSDEEGQDHE